MIQLLTQLDRASLPAALGAHAREVAASMASGDRSLVGRAEAEVKTDPAAHFRFDHAGCAALHACGRTFQAGSFETPRLGDLRNRAKDARQRAGNPAAALRLFVIDGASPATDIGALQAYAPPDALFQVASQFNCLESPSAKIVPVADYFYDPTQGPRASISAFPGTLVRHYAAPAAGGARFVQGIGGHQINLLSDVCAPDLATVRSGYLRSDSILDPVAFARTLEERFDDIRIGVHDDLEVVFGHNWDGMVPSPPPRIAQVFTPTIALGGYSDDDGSAALATTHQQLLRGAYLATLLAAAALGKSYAVLTLVGRGAFGNPIPAISEAILWSVEAAEPLIHQDLTVIVNGRSLGQNVTHAALRRATLDRGGVLVVFDGEAVAVG